MIAALKPSNAGVAAYRDAERDYAEIAVLAAVLRPLAKAPRLIALIHRAVPYPLVLIAAEPRGVTLSLAHKRASQAESDKVVVEGVKCTPPLSPDTSPVHAAFLRSLALSARPAGNLHELYAHWLHCIEALEAAGITGRYAEAGSPERASVREAALDTYAGLDREIARLRAEAARERQVNRRVELNLRIRDLEAELEDARRDL